MVLRQHLCRTTRKNFQKDRTKDLIIIRHTVVIFIIIISFVFTVYASSPRIGSISNMYDLLVIASQKSPIADNQDGSLVTMSSLQALIFG